MPKTAGEPCVMITVNEIKMKDYRGKKYGVNISRMGFKEWLEVFFVVSNEIMDSILGRVRNIF